MQVQNFTGGDNEGKTMFRGKTLSLLSHKNKIIAEREWPPPREELLPRGPPVQRRPPVQRGSPAQGASCPDGPLVQSVSCPKRPRGLDGPLDSLSREDLLIEGLLSREPPVQRGLLSKEGFPTGGPV